MIFFDLWHWVLNVTGDNTAGTRWNLAWSGFLSAGVITTGIFTGVFHKMREVNCGAHGCWRIGRYPYEKDGVTHKLCKHDHPGLQGKTHTREEFRKHFEKAS